ncbi:hypothetical protein N8I77_006430 [Diaporthe amygdali]|uniref:Uncharacterized protein n=1 Tax=Phomopsis amygdali TaxID=1214568 RepID=A0AAD9W3T5_PHOAM|nr:hypothetical protein N8I77_006430 [Diaporthe amygdali]
MSTSIAAFTNTLGPLTTAWAQPASCTTGVAANNHEAWLDQSCVGDSFGGNPSCWPPRTEGAASLSGALSTWGIYSPGTACPSGKVAACSYDGSKSTGAFQFYFPPGPSETAIGCCPSGYFCYGEQKCALSISSSTVSTLQCSDGRAVDLATLSIPYTTTQSSSVATISTFSAYAPLLQLMYQSSDISSTTSPPSTTSTSSGQETNSSGGQGLSTGASAGIGVGVGLGVIILAAAAFWFWRVRRKNMKTAAPNHASNSENFRDSRPGGSEAKSPQELQGYLTVPEIDSRTTLQEVPGGGLDGPRVDAARVQQISPVELA